MKIVTGVLLFDLTGVHNLNGNLKNMTNHLSQIGFHRHYITAQTSNTQLNPLCLNRFFFIEGSQVTLSKKY